MSDWREFCSDWWLERVAALEAEWPDGVPVNWHANRVLWDCGLFAVNREVAAGQLAVMGNHRHLAGPRPTPTDVNHAHHLFMAGWPREPRGVFIEWGGGFGNMARLTRRQNPGQSHVIVDIPIMQNLQREFLNPGSSGIGANVQLTGHNELPALVHDRPVDTFMAAYSLDECSAAAHDWVFDRDWFGARTVLVVAQTEGKDDMFPDGRGLVSRLRAAGFTETPAWSEGSSYFRLDR